MLASASAYELCRRAGGKLQIVWFKGWGMQAYFSDLFKPADDDVVTVRDGFARDWPYQRPRKRNLWLPKLAQRIMFRQALYCEDVIRLRYNFDFEQWISNGPCYMNSCYGFISTDDFIYSKLFKPVDAIAENLEVNRQLLGSTAIGMHIRRTDNAVSIAKSPTSLFIEKGKEELAANQDATIYLATDSEDVKKEMNAVFGDRIVTARKAASRDSVEGIRDGIVDMWTLSFCQKIYGSAGSTFSEMAAKLSNGTASHECLSL